MKNQRGFTLIELVLVVVLLGILAIAALPSLVEIYNDAATARCSGTIGAIRSGLGIYRTNNLIKVGPPGVYPTTLDSATDGFCTDTNRCFGTVIMNGVGSSEPTGSGWTRLNSTSYVCTDEYTGDGGTAGWIYIYYPASGEFGL